LHHPFTGDEEYCLLDLAEYPKDLFGEEVKKVVPYGYAGNPASFQKYRENMKKLYEIMCDFIVQQL